MILSKNKDPHISARGKGINKNITLEKVFTFTKEKQRHLKECFYQLF